MSRLQQCDTTVDSGDTWQGCALSKGKGSKERVTAREITKKWKRVRLQRHGKGKRVKVGGGIKKGEGKGNGLQSMSDRDEWNQNDEYYNVPILSLSCGEKHI